nr:hypothetical protein [Tanacetum cinerariifolium]
MEFLNPWVVVAAKLPILNPNEFDLWKMRIEQYFLMTNYSFWEVIPNGDSPSPIRIVDGAIQIGDINLKFLRSLSSEWKTHTLIWGNKADLEDQSLDNLFNNLKIYEAKVKGSSPSSQNTQNIAFVSLNNSDSTNGSVNDAPGLFAASSKATVSTLPNVDSLSDESFQADEEPTNYALMAYATSGSSSSSGSDNEFYVLSYKTSLESVEARLDVYQQNETMFEEDIKLLQLNVMLRDNALAELRKKFKKAEKERDELKLTLEKFQTSSKNLSKLLEIQVSNKTGLGFESQVFTSQVLDYEELHSHESDNSVPKNPENDRNVVPKEVLTRSRLVSLNAARPVSTDVPQSTIKSPRPVKHVVNKAHSPIRRPINHKPATKNSNFNKKVTTVKVNKVNNVHGTEGNAEKASAYWVWKPKCEVLDHVSRLTSASMTLKKFDYTDALGRSKGCLIHMTRNISFLLDFKEINGGYVAFGGNHKGGKISGKGKIKTSKFDFDDVYFVKELKFNLLSVSQMCDKKNSVLFTDTECVVLSSDFKLPNENHVLLRVLRENNMYNVDLKNVVPSGDLTCHFAKATLDESNFWHRRLGHINFKTINKLVKGKLVIGSPSKIFENNHTCVAYKKGKQHKASWIRPKWLFDIDTLTMSMNYQPIVKRNQPNDNADDDAAFDGKENENDVYVSANRSDKNGNKKHYEKAKRDDKGKSHVDSPSGVRDLRAEFEEFSFNCTNRVNAVSVPVNATERNLTNSTQNKKDERGIVIRNKARLVTQGHTQEEGIDYDEFFTLVARIEAIRLFLAYVSFMGFMVYQMDVKSAFLYGTIKEEVYVCQPLGFEDPDYPNKVYKVVKALYGLHQSPRAWYETLANYLLENSFQRGKIDQTLFIKKQKGDIFISSGLLVKQKDDGIFISQDKYVAKILRKFGFTYVKSASTPIETNKPLLKDPDDEDVDVHIYRYLKGKPHLGLWYPKDSPFNLVAYSDSDYARASLDRKSIRGGCQFLGCILISWQCKKHTVVATSSTEAEYIAAASCCAQGVNTPRYDEDIIELKELMVFMATATVKKVNDAVQLRALTDGKKLVVAEDIIRRDLHLDDADGVECLPNEEIFEELARMCYEKPLPKLTFHKTFFSAQWKFLIHTLVQCLSAKRTTWNDMVRNVDNHSKFLMHPHFLQVVLDNQVDDMSTHNTRYTSHALTQKVFANIRRAGKGFLGVETYLFASMLVQPQPHFEEVEEEVEMPIAPAPPSLTSAPSPPLQDPTLTPHATSPQYQHSTPHALPPQE